jgi:eukaryotic-like serine/threonine-protein kinase
VRGVGPGTTLGDRYALRRRLSHGPELERWSALDGTLNREVTLTVVAAGHPNCAAVIDAARRAAGVEDARLVRILDVGAQNDTAFIVEESRSGSESLATTLLRGPLPAEEARRIAGETAKGLETAGQRGLHHLRLTPHSVLIAPDGAVKVSGVTVAAAIEGPGEQEPDAGTALRRDALCLVAIVYAGLTSRWPLDEKVPGFESAPRVGAVVVAPSEIVAGIPGDLDTLCRTTLNEGRGPLTPGDFALQVAPWPHERIHRAGVDPTLVLRLPGPDSDSNLAPVAVPSVVPVAVPVTGHKAEATVAAPKEDLASQSPSNRPQAPVNTPAAAGAAAASMFGTPFDGSGATAGAVVGPPSSSAMTAADARADDSVHGDNRMRLPMGLSSKDEVGPPLPMLPASTALPPSRGQSKVVMVVMAVFVVAALVVGYRGLLGPGSDASQGRPTPRRTVTVSGPAVTVPASPAPQAASTAGGPIAILSATGFDPQGDQGENNSQAARVYDGNPATSWTSELYNTAQFGNLKKGVGLLLDLGQPTSVHQVSIDLANGPVDVTVYAATSPSLTGAAEIGTAKAATGQVRVKAATTMPESEFIIVWFSSLAPEGGQFGASVSEIALN